MSKKILYTPIDFVGSDKQARNFNIDYSERLLKAKRAIEESKFPIHLSLKTTVIEKDKYGWGISKEGVEEFDKAITKLRQAGIDYYVDTWPSGPTRSMYGTIFDLGGTIAFSSIATGDLDQFPPQANLEKILELYNLVKKENAIMGMGSRSVPIVLSTNPENAHLRRIFEGVMNLAVRNAADINKNKIITPENYEIPNDPAYTKTGDFITGIYLTNSSHTKAGELVNLLEGTARQNNFFGFEDEYYMAIVSAIFGNIAAINFNSRTNPFEEEDIQVEKEKIIKKQIKAPLEKLANTPANAYIRKAIEEARTSLGEFYDKSKIDEVTTYMLEALVI